MQADAGAPGPSALVPDRAATGDDDTGPPASEGLSKNAQKKLAAKAKKEAAKAAKKAAGSTSAADGGAAAASSHSADGGGLATMNLEPPTGTRDFYPDDMRVRNWLFSHFRDVARRFNFQEYDAPVLEYDALYKRKAGEEIVSQMYNFVDKDGHEVTLRPEMTPSCARMVLGLGSTALLPLKWFSVPQCWRYEHVQRGRKREHFQWNMDIFGEPSISAELELLAAIVTFFEGLGITSADVGLKVNSRRVLSCVLDAHGVAADQFEKVCVVVDKLDKIGPEATVAELETKGVGKDAGDRIVKSLEATSFHALRDLLGEAAEPAIAELQDLFDLAEAYGIRDWLTFDASVVRGLAYYTGVVFEGFDKSKTLRAICGGGRYDRLLSLYGAPTPTPACGFGFGDCVIMELLAMKGLVPPLPAVSDFVVVPFDKSMQGPALKVARVLRGGGFTVDMLLRPDKRVKNAFSYADRVGGRRVVFVAPDEWERGEVAIKDMRAGVEQESKQVALPFTELLDRLAAMDM